MSVYQKYYDLSSDDNDASSLDSSSSEEEKRQLDETIEDDQDDDLQSPLQQLWARSILHMDVDCFYVQCEELDRGLRLDDQLQRPLAIGQKHIVVTCNYVARSRGVKKLMSKTDALRICPDLRIVDGSDLRRYRTHSRRIYEAFRVAVQQEVGSILHAVSGGGSEKGGFPRQSDRAITEERNSRQQELSLNTIEKILPCKRNAMDEMMADISTAVNKLVEIQSEKGEAKLLDLLSHLSPKTNGRISQTPRQEEVSKLYVFGDDSTSAVVNIVEDQTGASSNIVLGGGNSWSQGNSCADRTLAPTRRNVHECSSSNMNRNRNTDYLHHRNKMNCRKRLEIAARLGRWICERIYTSTGFHVSAGISVSPMLAKLSVIQKPKTVNLLLPWRSSELMYCMPLRKMHEIGSRTYRALSQAVLPEISEVSSAPTITVRDFLRVPRERIVDALLMMLQRENGRTNGTEEISHTPQRLWSGSATDRSLCEQKCDLILDRCRGFDCTQVEDDGGGLPQTVSVEDSFRRGTITTEAAVRNALADLCRRLPPLIHDRVAWSRDPSLAYPTTIRLTVRAMRRKSLPQSATPRRRSSSTITRSKQVSIGMQRGKVFLISSGNMTSKAQEEARAVGTLRDLANPLLQQLVFQSEKTDWTMNVTRMNLAVANFQDVIVKDSSYPSPSIHRVSSNTIHNTGGNEYLSQGQWSSDTKSLEGAQNKKRKPSVVTTPSSTNRWAAKAPSSGASKEGSKKSRKFARTRIDQFFVKKQR